MKIVIQCAGRKKTPKDAGFRSSDKRLIKFVAHPGLAPNGGNYVYVRPDDSFDGAQTWRSHLLDYNRKYKDSKNNPHRLLPAYQLYSDPIYQKLFEKSGIERVFILSAGWGLIRSDFLTPNYDITFSRAKNVKPYAKREKLDFFPIFNVSLTTEMKLYFSVEKIIFLCSKV